MAKDGCQQQLLWPSLVGKAIDRDPREPGLGHGVRMPLSVEDIIELAPCDYMLIPKATMCSGTEHREKGGHHYPLIDCILCGLLSANILELCLSNNEQLAH